MKFSGLIPSSSSSSPLLSSECTYVYVIGAPTSSGSKLLPCKLDTHCLLSQNSTVWHVKRYLDSLDEEILKWSFDWRNGNPIWTGKHLRTSSLEVLSNGSILVSNVFYEDVGNAVFNCSLLNEDGSVCDSNTFTFDVPGSK